MNSIIRVLFLFSTLLISELAFADSGLTKDVPITVTMVANVQEQISKLSPAEKKRAENAIKVVAAFMQHYLDGLACDTEHQNWDEEVGGLVAMDSYNWGGNFCSAIESPKVSGYEPNSRALREMCSQVALSDFRFEDGGVSLTYQMTKLGTLILNSPIDEIAFDSINSGEKELIIIAVNADNRVYKVAPKDSNQEIAYNYSVLSMKRYVQYPIGGIGDTQASLKAQVIRDKELIKQIEQQADRVCK